MEKIKGLFKQNFKNATKIDLAIMISMIIKMLKLIKKNFGDNIY